jgi:hypothetical protein
MSELLCNGTSMSKSIMPSRSQSTSASERLDCAKGANTKANSLKNRAIEVHDQHSSVEAGPVVGKRSEAQRLKEEL